MKRTLSEWLSWQESLHYSEIDLGLDRIRSVAMSLDVETLPFPVITIAGTNGKGSSVAFMDAMLQAQGYKTGAYTSPHLLRYNERIAINGKPANDQQICKAFEQIDSARANTSLTYFEFGTLAAILLFIQEKVDVIILEVGLGGRLDAANLWDASLAIITGIAIDHVSWLGSDRETIAIEKAGIMRKGKPVICGDPNPPKTIQSEAQKHGAILYQLNTDFSFTKNDDGKTWQFQFKDKSKNNPDFNLLPFPALQGEFQLNNVSGVIAGLRVIKEQLPVSESAIKQGLQTASIAGRMQIIQHKPDWLVDVAHNPQSAEQLANYLHNHPVKGKNLAIFSMLADKDIQQVIRFMKPHIDEWHIVTLGGSRGMDRSKLNQAMLKQSLTSNIYFYEDFEEVCRYLKKIAKNEDRVVAFGSFLLVSGVLKTCI